MTVAVSDAWLISYYHRRVICVCHLRLRCLYKNPSDDVSPDPWPEESNRPDDPRVGGPPVSATVATPSLQEILRVVFDIGVGERETYVALAARECGSAAELADDLDRDRSNVNRYLNSLFQKGLVTRRRRILQSGGHVYQYSARPPEEVRGLLRAGLQEWTGTASEHIDDLVADIDIDRAGADATETTAPAGEERATACRVERR